MPGIEYSHSIPLHAALGSISSWRKISALLDSICIECDLAWDFDYSVGILCLSQPGEADPRQYYQYHRWSACGESPSNSAYLSSARIDRFGLLPIPFFKEEPREGNFKALIARDLQFESHSRRLEKPRN